MRLRGRDAVGLAMVLAAALWARPEHAILALMMWIILRS